MITNVGTVSVFVSDQDKALEFYTKKLGFELKGDEKMGPDQRWIEVAPKGAFTRIVLYRPSREMPGADSYEDAVAKIGKMTNLVFGVDDIEKTFKEFKSNGVNIVNDLEKHPWGWWGVIADPDGNTFGVHAF